MLCGSNIFSSFQPLTAARADSATYCSYKRKIEQQESSDNAKHAQKARDGALDDPFGPSAPPSTDATPAPTSGVPSVTVKTEPDMVKTEQPVDPM